MIKWFNNLEVGDRFVDIDEDGQEENVVVGIESEGQSKLVRLKGRYPWKIRHPHTGRTDEFSLEEYSRCYEVKPCEPIRSPEEAKKSKSRKRNS